MIEVPTNVRQRGMSTVEFAIVGAVFFMVLIAVIEVSRALYVWNGLTEVSRRAARVATVCPINHPAIARVAVFDSPAGAGNSPVIHGLTINEISVQYLDENGTIVGDTVGNFRDIRYVRGSIVGFQHTLLIPFVSSLLTINSPDFATTVPRESLGIPREGASPICFGS